MPFDPDAFLAEPAANVAVDPQAAPKTVPQAPVSQAQPGIPAPLLPPPEPFDPDKFLAPENEALYGNTSQKLKTFGEAFLRGFGSQPIATGLEVAAGVPKEDILGRQKTNFWTGLAGEITGFGLGAVTGTGEAGVLAKVLPKASAPIKAIVDGLVLASGDEASRAILQDPDQTAQSAIAHIGLGGALSGVIGSVGPLWRFTKEGPLSAALNMVKGDSEGVGGSLIPEVLGPTGGGAAAKEGAAAAADIEMKLNPDGSYSAAIPPINNFIKGAINVVLGPSHEMIDARVANLERIRAAPEFQDVYDKILSHLDEVGENVVSQKQILADAVKEFEKSGYDAALANQAAKAALKDSQMKLISHIERDAISKAPGVANAVELLRRQVTEGSQASYDLLRGSNQTVSLMPLYQAGNEMVEKVSRGVSDQSLRYADVLKGYLQNASDKYGLQLSGENAKAMIQELDRLSTWNPNAAEFDTNLSPYYRQLRGILNKTLGETIEGYAAKQAPVAQKAKLLSNLSGYGTPEAATKSIYGLTNTPKFVNEMPFLRELEQHTGVKFTHDLDHYASPNLQKLRISQLPEYAEAKRAADALAYYKHPETYEALIHSIMNDPEWLSAMDAKEAMKGLTESSLQGKMNAVMGGKNIAARALLNRLPKLDGMSIPEILDLIAVRQHFEKQNTNGSRLVNALSILGGSVGGLTGGMIGGIPGASIGGALGTGAGAITGATLDKTGPALAAKLLDKYVESFGNLGEKAGISRRAARRALQVILGTESHGNGAAFKATADYVENASKGMEMTKKAARAVFLEGATVVPKEFFPEKEKLKQLDTKLKDLKEKPVEMFAFGGEVGHYMPAHSESIAKVGGNAVAQLNAERPEVPKNAPLDADLSPSMASKAKYNRSLENAEQPLMLFHRVKNGTITAQDVNTVKALYPQFLNQMKKELTDALTDHMAKDKPIHHGLRRGIATMLEQPMDSTMRQPNMQSVMRANAQMQPPVPQGKPKKKGASSTAISQINKVNSMFQTDEDKQQTPYNRGK